MKDVTESIILKFFTKQEIKAKTNRQFYHTFKYYLHCIYIER